MGRRVSTEANSIQMLFGGEATPPASPGDFLSILPVSVLDIEAQGVRVNESHSNTSSRQNYSPFPKEVATLCCEFFLRDCKTVFDPFAGWGERNAAATSMGMNYVGFDISPTAIEVAKNRNGVSNTLADSLTAPIPAHDGLLTCPPYWNLEKYESSNGIDRAKTWGEFLSLLRRVFERCYLAANPSAVFCVMVGEWRSKGVFYDLEYETRRMFKDFGATLFDAVVVSRKKISKIKIMLPQCKRLGYSVRVHETLLVFKKGAE